MPEEAPSEEAPSEATLSGERVEAVEPAGSGELVDLREALENVRRVAALHFLGGAFDPEHMRAIANYCAGVLNGEPVPDDLGSAPEAYFLRVLRENGWCVTASPLDRPHP